jgi:hypothetical protein
MKKPIGTMLIIFLPILLSCATTLPGRQYTQGSIIDMGNFSVIGPPGNGWFVNIQKDQRKVEFQKRNVSQSTGFINESTLIHVLQNWVADEKLKRLSEEEVADDFRMKEELGMLFRGVGMGKYELTDVKKETTIIDDKKLYLMSYRTSGVGKPVPRKWISEAVLYLFFPADFKERHFFYCFLIQQVKAEGFFGAYDLTPIIPVINSLKIK